MPRRTGAATQAESSACSRGSAALPVRSGLGAAASASEQRPVLAALPVYAGLETRFEDRGRRL